MSTDYRLEPSARYELVSWTWADIVSTWRFWALLISYLLSGAAVTASSILLSRLAEQLSMRPVELAPLLGVRFASQVFGFYIAYVASRTKPLRVLILAGALQFLGSSLVIVPGAVTPFSVRMFGAVCWGVGFGALLLTIPAAVAGALGGTRLFVVAFGMIVSLNWLLNAAVTTPLVGLPGSAVTLVPMLLFAALVVLLPVRAELFNEPPPPRGRAFPIVRRGPVAVAFLCLIPFYPLYWLFRAHGEVASLAASHLLLSPRAAVGMAFVPLMFPIVMTALTDQLNAHALRTGKQRMRSPAEVFLLSLFLPPVGIAFVQSAMNRAMTQ